MNPDDVSLIIQDLKAISEAYGRSEAYNNVNAPGFSNVKTIFANLLKATAQFQYIGDSEQTKIGLQVTVEAANLMLSDPQQYKIPFQAFSISKLERITSSVEKIREDYGSLLSIGTDSPEQVKKDYKEFENLHELISSYIYPIDGDNIYLTQQQLENINRAETIVNTNASSAYRTVPVLSTVKNLAIVNACYDAFKEKLSFAPFANELRQSVQLDKDCKVHFRKNNKSHLQNLSNKSNTNKNNIHTSEKGNKNDSNNTLQLDDIIKAKRQIENIQHYLKRITAEIADNNVLTSNISILTDIDDLINSLYKNMNTLSENNVLGSKKSINAAVININLFFEIIEVEEAFIEKCHKLPLDKFEQFLNNYFENFNSAKLKEFQELKPLLKRMLTIENRLIMSVAEAIKFTRNFYHGMAFLYDKFYSSEFTEQIKLLKDLLRHSDEFRYYQDILKGLVKFQFEEPKQELLDLTIWDNDTQNALQNALIKPVQHLTRYNLLFKKFKTYPGFITPAAKDFYMAFGIDSHIESSKKIPVMQSYFSKAADETNEQKRLDQKLQAKRKIQQTNDIVQKKQPPRQLGNRISSLYDDTLLQAAEQNDTIYAKQILEANFPSLVNQRYSNSCHSTVLQVSSYHGNEKFVDFLLNLDIDQYRLDLSSQTGPSHNGNTALAIATLKGQNRIAKKLAMRYPQALIIYDHRQGERQGYMPIHLAIVEDNAGGARELLRLSANDLPDLNTVKSEENLPVNNLLTDQLVYVLPNSKHNVWSLSVEYGQWDLLDEIITLINKNKSLQIKDILLKIFNCANAMDKTPVFYQLLQNDDADLIKKFKAIPYQEFLISDLAISLAYAINRNDSETFKKIINIIYELSNRINTDEIWNHAIWQQTHNPLYYSVSQNNIACIDTLLSLDNNNYLLTHKNKNSNISAFHLSVQAEQWLTAITLLHRIIATNDAKLINESVGYCFVELILIMGANSKDTLDIWHNVSPQELAIFMDILLICKQDPDFNVEKFIDEREFVIQDDGHLYNKWCRDQNESSKHKKIHYLKGIFSKPSTSYDINGTLFNNCQLTTLIDDQGFKYTVINPHGDSKALRNIFKLAFNTLSLGDKSNDRELVTRKLNKTLKQGRNKQLVNGANKPALRTTTKIGPKAVQEYIEQKRSPFMEKTVTELLEQKAGTLKRHSLSTAISSNSDDDNGIISTPTQVKIGPVSFNIM